MNSRLRVFLISATLAFGVGCGPSEPGNSMPLDTSESPSESQTSEIKELKFSLTTQIYDAETGGYGEAKINMDASAEQIESAINSVDWSPGSVRPIIKLIRRKGEDPTAYLKIRRNQNSGETIEILWQHVDQGNEIAKMATANDVEQILKIAMAFTHDEEMTTLADWKGM